MKYKNRVLVALISALMLLALAAPLAQALESAPFAVMQGGATRFELFGKFKNDGSIDRNTRYTDFTSVTVENVGIAEAYLNHGKWYIIGKAVDGITTFTATLPNGETVTGSIMSFKKWETARWGAPFVGLLPATSYVALNRSQSFTVYGTGKKNTDYTWAISNNALGTITADGVFTANAIEGRCTVTATDKANNTIVYAAAISVYNPATPLTFAALPSVTVFRGNYSGAIYPTYPNNWFGPRGGSWSVGNSAIARIMNNGDGSVSIYGVYPGNTTYRFTDAVTGAIVDGTITVN